MIIKTIVKSSVLNLFVSVGTLPAGNGVSQVAKNLIRSLLLVLFCSLIFII